MLYYTTPRAVLQEEDFFRVFRPSDGTDSVTDAPGEILSPEKTTYRRALDAMKDGNDAYAYGLFCTLLEKSYKDSLTYAKELRQSAGFSPVWNAFGSFDGRAPADAEGYLYIDAESYPVYLWQSADRKTGSVRLTEIGKPVATIGVPIFDVSVDLFVLFSFIPEVYCP